MMLKVFIEEREFAIQIPDAVLRNGEEFFHKMDRDMDKGWQMSREWVENPDTLQRCQIAADKIADALSSQNETLLQLMAGYILSRMPHVTEVHIDTAGEMSETRFLEGSA
jgi:hypothetical protein